ncbi:MAG: condensation domain-containing protein, partial [Thermoguttaceae bacterium]|nr:condensation domain-containing protein [Thermoguttaceae bacterium]
MKDAFPLLLSQRAVYIQCQTSGESTQYNLPFCYSYGQTVKPEHLVQSLRAAFAIHTGFRMRLGLDEHGQVYQYPDTEELKIDTVQLTESEFEIWKSQWMRPFDLLHEPLVRVALVLMNKQVFLFWDAHHIVCDGTSHMAFNATLGEILRGKAPMIEAIDLKQAVTMERQRTQPQRVEEDLAWYGTVLSGCETTALTRRPDKVDSRLETVVRVVASQRVDEACGGAQVPPSVFFMSVLSLSLAKWTQVDTVQLCVVNHGRWDKSLARTSGMFVRTLPIAVDVASEKTTADFLRSNRQLLRELWTHQSVPLGELLDRYGLSMEVSYSWQGFYGSSLGGAQSLEKLPLTQPLRPLSVQVFVEEGKYIVHTEYDTACFRASDMESF